MKNLKLWKIWHDDGKKEKTTWEKELPTIKKNFSDNVDNIYKAVQNIYPNGTVSISNFSSIKLRK